MAAKRKYNWDGLFCRPHTVLVRGIDYNCSQSTIVAMVRNNASMRGLRVRVTDNDCSITVEVVGAVLHTDTVTVADQSAPSLA